MLSMEEAKKIVEGYLNSPDDETDDVVVIDRVTKVLPEGWIFHYNTKEFASGADLNGKLAGNSPIFVDRSTGKLLVLYILRGNYEEQIAEFVRVNR